MALILASTGCGTIKKNNESSYNTYNKYINMSHRDYIQAQLCRDAAERHNKKNKKKLDKKKCKRTLSHFKSHLWKTNGFWIGRKNCIFPGVFYTTYKVFFYYKTMKAIILAAGEGTRLRPMTYTIPKPLIKVMGVPIIEHNIKHIYKQVDEIIIVVGYKQEMFREFLGDNYKGTKITYQTQSEEKWTAAALFWLDSDLDVIIMNADAIFEKKDLEELLTLKGYWALVQTVEEPKNYGIFQISEATWYIQQVIEKPQEEVWNLASLWAYKFHSKIFEYIKNVKKSPRGEYEITDAINEFAKNYPFKPLEISWKFIDVWYPWHLLDANQYLLWNISDKIQGNIEDWVYIKGNIILEEGACIKSGSYIEWNVYIWKNTQIWPNAYIRWNTSIGESSKIWNAVEINNSYIWDHTNIAHLSYIWDSIIGNHVNLGWGFMVANLRHDEADIKCMIKWKLVNTKRRKFWVIIWDNTKTGMNTSVYPGRVLDNNIYTLPGEIVK